MSAPSLRGVGLVVAMVGAVLLVGWLACQVRPQCRAFSAGPDLGDPPLGWPAASAPAR